MKARDSEPSFLLLVYVSLMCHVCAASSYLSEVVCMGSWSLPVHDYMFVMVLWLSEMCYI